MPRGPRFRSYATALRPSQLCPEEGDEARIYFDEVLTTLLSSHESLFASGSGGHLERADDAERFEESLANRLLFLDDHLVLGVDVEPAVVVDDPRLEEAAHDGVADVHPVAGERVAERARVSVDDSSTHRLVERDRLLLATVDDRAHRVRRARRFLLDVVALAVRLDGDDADRRRLLFPALRRRERHLRHTTTSLAAARHRLLVWGPIYKIS